MVLFQRGAMDGLNIVVPFAEPNYYRIRPTIAIPQPRAAARQGGARSRRLLRPASESRAACCRSFSRNQLAIVHAVGSPDPTRSHFDAQDFMESGTPGVKATEDGWLNRALQIDARRACVAVPRRGHWAVSCRARCEGALPPSRFPI